MSAEDIARFIDEHGAGMTEWQKDIARRVLASKGPLQLMHETRSHGRRRVEALAIAYARETGQHAHVAGPNGVTCAARDRGDCTLPPWEGLEP